MLVVHACRAALVSADWSRSNLQDTYNSCLMSRTPFQSLSFKICKRVKNHSSTLPRRAVFRIDFDAMWMGEPAMKGGHVYFILLYALCGACVCVYACAYARRTE